MKKVMYAITAHGFGHATRALVIARRLKQYYPDINLTISSAVDPEAIRRFIPDMNQHFGLRQQDYEPGLIQKSCFEVDPQATISRYLSLTQELEARIEAETAYLALGNFDGVISDVAAIPLAGAATLGIPSLVIGNFTWDWILKPLIENTNALAGYYADLQRQYASAAVYLRLPFHAPEHPFNKVEEAPLIGRRSVLSKSEILSRVGIVDDSKRPIVLVAVGGWNSEALQDIVIEGCSDYRLLVIGDLPISARRAELLRLPFSLGKGISFPDLVRIADACVVKPGFSTCAELVLNRAAMVGIERRNMRETEVLDERVGDYIPSTNLSLDNFFAGQWDNALETVLAEEVPEPEDLSMELTAMIVRIGETLKL